MLSRDGKDGQDEKGHDLLDELRVTRDETRKLFSAHLDGLKGAGWDLEVGALETRAGTRAVIAFGE